MRSSSGFRNRTWVGATIAFCAVAMLAGAALADQDKYTVTAPNGIAFSEFRGYEKWQDVAVSRTDTGIKAILGNPAMIKAYQEGIPANGKPFPDGSVIVKIQWDKAPNPVSPYAVEVPTTLASVSLSKRTRRDFLKPVDGAMRSFYTALPPGPSRLTEPTLPSAKRSATNATPGSRQETTSSPTTRRGEHPRSDSLSS